MDSTHNNMLLKILKSNSDTCATALHTVVNKCLNDVEFPVKLEVVNTKAIFKYKVL